VKKVIILNKKEGETPLLALENFRSKNHEYLDIPITYAGRLDPMASGVLILLAGEEIKNKEKYLALDKEYSFSVLFGFSTDTYDILGKVITARQQTFFGKQELTLLIKDNLKYFKGKIKQKYPIYSSKTVKGRPLFSYARGGENVEIPEREIFVKKLELKGIRRIGSKSLFINIKKRITKVKGDFRQKDILKTWQKNLLLVNKNKIFYIADFKTTTNEWDKWKFGDKYFGLQLKLYMYFLYVYRSTSSTRWSK
jgi:tRNA pseudouridine(55) synthase